MPRLEEAGMPDEITPELFEHLVELAALELEPEEAEALRRQLNNQLNVIHELAAIDITGVPITTHGVPYGPVLSQPLRPDAVQDCDDPEAILAQAPQVEDRYVVVPDIPHEELA